MKQWCIIQFSIGDTELVPHEWVHGEKVFWPPLPFKRDWQGLGCNQEEGQARWQTFEPIRIHISRGGYCQI